MAQIIEVNFKERKVIKETVIERKYTLKDARIFLGGGYFRKALFDWSMGELQRCTNSSEAQLTGAAEAYEAILNYRINHQDDLRILRFK